MQHPPAVPLEATNAREDVCIFTHSRKAMASVRIVAGGCTNSKSDAAHVPPHRLPSTFPRSRRCKRIKWIVQCLHQMAWLLRSNAPLNRSRGKIMTTCSAPPTTKASRSARNAIVTDTAARSTLAVLPSSCVLRFHGKLNLPRRWILGETSCTWSHSVFHAFCLRPALQRHTVCLGPARLGRDRNSREGVVVLSNWLRANGMQEYGSWRHGPRLHWLNATCQDDV